MEMRNILFSAILVASAFVLTTFWPVVRGDPVIVIAAMIFAGALAALFESMDTRLSVLENKLDAKERSLRVNIQGVEENVERKLTATVKRINEAVESLTKREYR
ncbi:MAG: hypothetical protein BME93_05995 [Methanosarcinales archaeon Met12]|nr:MAG: hypothetical protein BME93_05995 [Methanosarcinales archaeon Met12]